MDVLDSMTVQRVGFLWLGLWILTIQRDCVVRGCHLVSPSTLDDLQTGLVAWCDW